MSSHTATHDNAFTTGPLGAIFARTALPVIFVMSMNGLLAVVDAMFLGAYVGADALSAVTLMFPFYMLIVAMATLVAGGMSSVLARHLGGGRQEAARAVFAGAHGLALTMAAGLIATFLLFGRRLTLVAAGGAAPLAEMGHGYLAILVLFSPLAYVLSVQSDALRNEGRVGIMAAASLLVSLANICFDYLLIARAGLGVAGSAYGTVLAQALAMAVVIAVRLSGRTVLRPGDAVRHSLLTAWRSMLALGAPQSLNFLGLALGSAAIIAALQMVGPGNFATTVSAYGIVTRILTFVFLPLLGLSHAMQTIAGNNHGAALWQRTDTCLRLGMAIALIYCLTAQTVLTGFAGGIARAFVADAAVVAEVARIMPVMVAMLFVAGPLVMIATHFQAIGDAGRAAILGLSKPYAFAIPLTFLLPLGIGEAGIWLAGPTAELLLLGLTAAVLADRAQRHGLRWGLFGAADPAPGRPAPAGGPS